MLPAHKKKLPGRTPAPAVSVGRRVILLGTTVHFQLRYHAGLVEKLTEEGWHVHVVSSDGAWLERMSQVEHVVVHVVDMAREPSVWSDARALLEWLTILRRVRPDISFIGTPKAALLGNIASSVLGVPTRIYELHGLRLEGATGVGRHLLTLIERITCTLATRVVAVGPSLAQAAVAARVVKPSRVEVLGAGSPNGVPVEEIGRASRDAARLAELRTAHGIRADELVIVYVGRIARDKGIDVLLSAGTLLAGAGHVVRTILVGPVEDEAVRDQVAKTERTSHRVTLVGEADNVADYLGIATVFCLPTKREGLPTVVLEAFAARVPVVSTRATGVVDLVRHEETGLLSDIGDPVGMSLNIARIASDANLRASLTANAHNLVTREFDTKLVHKRYLDYLEACEDHRRRTSSRGGFSA